MRVFNEKFHKGMKAVTNKAFHIAYPFLLPLMNRKNNLLIFYFHGIYESAGQRELHHIDPQENITVGQFRKFIEFFLKHNYYFLRPEDLSSPLPADKKYLLITFDDGYFNNIHIIKTLEEYSVPATIFLTSSYIQEHRSFWWDIIYKFRFRQGSTLSKIREEQLRLKKLKWLEIDEYITKEFGKEAHKPWSDIDRPLTEEEIKSITMNPFISIGNHTQHHAILTNYNVADIKMEIHGCNEYIKLLTGKDPISIAFPNGNFDFKVMEAMEDLSLKFAFTTQNHLNKIPLPNESIIQLGRFMSKNEKVEKYASYPMFGYNENSLYEEIEQNFKSIISRGSIQN